MNKAQLIQALSEHYNGSKAEAAKALGAVVQTITYQAAAGEKVSISGFGVFEKISRGERMVRNPRTGERKLAARPPPCRASGPGRTLRRTCRGPGHCRPPPAGR